MRVAKSWKALILAMIAFPMGLATLAKELNWGGPEWIAYVEKRRPWLEEVIKQPFPKTSIRGNYRGEAFVPEQVLFYRKVLQISKGRPTLGQAFVIQIPEHNVEGKTFYVLPKRTDKLSNVSLCYFDTTGHSAPYGQCNACGMKLQFGKMKNGRIPGYILLRIADQAGTKIEGYFYADVLKDGFYPDYE